jgi:aminoglycoside/choline kinase family phosphotransferase
MRHQVREAADLGRRMRSPRVAEHVALMLGQSCRRVEPIRAGADPGTRLARVELADGTAAIYKAFARPEACQREVRHLALAGELGEFAPRLLAHDLESPALLMEDIVGATLYHESNAPADELLAAALRALAEMHVAAEVHLEVTGQVAPDIPVWEPPASGDLQRAWRCALRAASGGKRVPVPFEALDALARRLAASAHDSRTLVLVDANPFNFIWTGSGVRMVDLGACRLGPSWLDLDLIRRMGLTEAKMVAAPEAYLEHRRALGRPILDEGEFRATADLWSVASALLAAYGFQSLAEGRITLSPALPEELLDHTRYRDDVLSDVWAICRRREELGLVADIMEEELPGNICQERHVRRKESAR